MAFLIKAGSVGGVSLVRRLQRSGDFDLLIEVAQPHEISPVAWSVLLEGLKEGKQTTIGSALATDAVLPPGTADQLVARLEELRPGVASVVRGLRDRLVVRPPQLTASDRNVREQRDSVALGLEMAGIDSREALPSAVDGNDVPFLRGLAGSTTQEAALLRHDVERFGRWVAAATDVYDVWRYVDPIIPERKLVVLYADKNDLERLTGTDLIYYREETDAFVLVQYKRMVPNEKGSRVSYRPDKQLTKELARMSGLGLTDSPASCVQDVRLSPEPFYLKLVDPNVDRPRGNRLAKGMYFPLDLFNLVRQDAKVKGQRGGVAIGWHNAMRYLTNGEFVRLVGGSWIGTRGSASAALSDLIGMTLANNRGLVVVVDQTEHEKVPSRRS